MYKNKFKQIILRIYFFLLLQIGIDIKRLYNTIKTSKRFISDYYKFKKFYKGKMIIRPCLQDWFESAGDVKSEYFIQDLFVSQKIYKANPNKHVDIGSRIDGFVSNVASFREIEIFDFREIEIKIPNINFKQADFSKDNTVINNYCDSLSCLHTLEHFGLGRYGDLIDINAYISGFENLAKCIYVGGIFYLSVPIGIERVEFNANRVFNPQKIINLSIVNNLKLVEFYIINKDFNVISVDFVNESEIYKLSQQEYYLGIFIFTKIL
mgnify:CR=1 FL=1